MSYGFLLAGFLATTNAGRVGLARAATAPPIRTRLLALGLGGALVVVLTAVAGDVLDALDVSPESFRIAAGLVLAATGVRELIWTRASGAPFAAILLTPELVCVTLSFGADEATGRVLGAAAPALALAAIVALRDRPNPGPSPAQLLAALQIVVAVALAVSGVRDV